MLFSLYTSLFGLYFFALAGFVLKKIFTKELNTKSIVILSIYILQPILGLWGFIKAPLVFDMLGVGVLYLCTAFFLAGSIFYVSKFFITDKKQQTIISFLGTSGNTGNIGIPLSSSLYGAVGVVVATVINFFNIIWNFIFGVYYYARGEKSMKKSLIEVLKMPLLWTSCLGIIINIFSVHVPYEIEYFLEIGAYSAICIQLLLLGIFISGIQVSKIEKITQSWVIFLKFILMPALGFLLLLVYQHFFGAIAPEIIAVFIIELCVPIAVNNGNLATLYNCYPQKVAESILISYIMFILFVPFGLVYFL
jgi:predicted permease